MEPEGGSGARVVVVGHFPPPLHGMSVATERFAGLLSARGPIVRLDISGNDHGRSAAHHAIRLARTLGTIPALARSRRGDRLYASCDAGPGMAYVMIVLAVARARRMRRYLHHHSYAYLRRRSRLMALLVRIAGADTEHVFTCPSQGSAFRELYPGARRQRTVPITYTLDEPTDPTHPHDPTEPPARRLVLGHFSNLSMAKGLGTAIATLDACLDAGIDAMLHLAGPVVDPAAADAIAVAAERHGTRLRHEGEVRGAAKDEYLRGLDVFLFPSRYRNESFGIVVAEAMAAGVPVVAHEAGCLDAAWVGDGGLVLGLDADFVAGAVAQLQRWVEEPSARRQAGRAAFERARAGWSEGCLAAEQLADEIVGASPGRAIGQDGTA